MFIQIDDNFAIKGELRQYVLCKSRKPSKKCPDGWGGFQYYHKLDHLIENLAEMMLRTSEARGVAEVLDENKRILHTLVQALSPHFDVEIREKTNG